MQKTKDMWMMNTTFQTMIERLRQSAKELENMSSLDINDEIIEYEYQIKFNEINKIVSILEDMLITETKEVDPLQLLTE